MSTKASIDLVSGVVLSILFAGNCFFVKNIFEKVNATEESLWALKVEVSALTARLGECGRFRDKGASYGPLVSKGQYCKAF